MPPVHCEHMGPGEWPSAWALEKGILSPSLFRGLPGFVLQAQAEAQPLATSLLPFKRRGKKTQAQWAEEAQVSMRQMGYAQLSFGSSYEGEEGAFFGIKLSDYWELSRISWPASRL